MATYLSVANGALSLIGAEDTIVDPDQDSHPARTVANAWDDVRREVLRGTEKAAPKWNFARSYAELPARAAPADDPVPYPWSSAYRMPSNNLRLDEIVYPQAAIDDYQLVSGGQGAEILTRTTGALKLWYIRDVEQVAYWDASFVAATKQRLAYEIADRITGDRSRKEDCWRAFMSQMLAAAKVDARENPPVETIEDDWVTVRRGYGGARLYGGAGFWR